MLLIHMVGASSAFELQSRLEDLIHLLPWVREIEIVLVGFKWLEQAAAPLPLAPDGKVRRRDAWAEGERGEGCRRGVWQSSAPWPHLCAEGYVCAHPRISHPCCAARG